MRVKKDRRDLEADAAAAEEELQELMMLAAQMEDNFGGWGELVAMYLGREHTPGQLEPVQPNWYDEKHQTGQKFGITGRQVKILLNNISSGMHLGVSLQLANIQYPLFRTWMQRGGSIKYSGAVDRVTDDLTPLSA